MMVWRSRCPRMAERLWRSAGASPRTTVDLGTTSRRWAGSLRGGLCSSSACMMLVVRWPSTAFRSGSMHDGARLRMECAGRAKRRRRFGSTRWPPDPAPAPRSQSGVALRLPPHSKEPRPVPQAMAVTWASERRFSASWKLAPRRHRRPVRIRVQTLSRYYRQKSPPPDGHTTCCMPIWRFLQATVAAGVASDLCRKRLSTPQSQPTRTPGRLDRPAAR